MATWHSRQVMLASKIRQEDQRLLLQVDASLWPQEDLAPWLMEIVLQGISAFFQAVIGQQIAEASLLFSAPPPVHAALYANYFLPRCEFNAPVNAFVLDARLASLPCPLHDEKTYRASLVRCREALDALLGPKDVVSRVKNLLLAHFDQIGSGGRGEEHAQPKLADAASRLCVSPRTLSRQLAEQSTTFLQLLEHEQREVACKLLAGQSHSVSEVSALLDYSDVINFDRVFRRMQQMSPGQFHQRASGKPD